MMFLLKRFLLWLTRVALALLVGVQLYFCGEVAILYVRQGLPTVLSYLRGDYIVVVTSNNAVRLMLKSPAHPYLSLAIVVVCFVVVTLGLAWLNGRLARAAHPGATN
jgi:hypothetical protein